MSFIKAVLCSCLAMLQLNAATMHAILVADLSDAVGIVAHKDLDLLHQKLEDICTRTNLEYWPALFVHKEFEPGTIMTYVRELRTGPDDVVVLYYSGHGFRSMKDDTPWPSLQCNAQGLRGVALINLITAKESRLNLILFDCCNSFCVPWQLPPMYQFGPEKAWEEAFTCGLKSLFMDAEGTYIMAAAEPGAVGRGSKARGSAFANTFFQTLILGAIQNKDWEYILGWTQKALKQQKPVLEILKRGEESSLKIW